MWKKLETRTLYFIAALFVTLFLTMTGAACTGKHNRVTVQNEEPDTAPLTRSTVRTGDPGAGAQLLSGFYAVENGSCPLCACNVTVGVGKVMRDCRLLFGKHVYAKPLSVPQMRVSLSVVVHANQH